MSGRRNPFRDIERLLERMSSQFESEWGGDLSTLGGELGVAVDVADHGDEYVVTADLPGYDKEDISVQLRGDSLHVSAERSTETEEEGGGPGEAGETGEAEGEGREGGRYIRRERTHRSVSRSVSLPDAVDEENVSASYRNGVLTVILPKAGAGEGHHIDID